MACVSDDGKNSAAQEDLATAPAPCTQDWFVSIDKLTPTGDGMGHGPDIGSEEWQSVVEFKLGLRGNPAVPERESTEWCDYIAKQIDANSP
jgi:hypothetical protein